MDLEFPLSSALDRCLTTGAHRGEGVLTGGFFPVWRWQPFHQGHPTINHMLPLKAVSPPCPPLILMSSLQDVPSSVPKDHSKTLNEALLQHTASVSDEAMALLEPTQDPGAETLAQHA